MQKIGILVNDEERTLDVDLVPVLVGHGGEAHQELGLCTSDASHQPRLAKVPEVEVEG